jgi:hypothetical protein
MNRIEIVKTSVTGLMASAIITLLSLLLWHVGQGSDSARKLETTQAHVLRRSEAPVLWEYETIAVTPEMYLARTGRIDSALQTKIAPDASVLTKTFGAKGWELVTAYLETETAFPNFGDEKYVTGIKSNIRPARLVMIFKRRVQK